MNYDEFDELPFILRIVTLLLYLVPVPLIMLAAINVFMIRVNIFKLPDIFWIISAGILLLLALFAYMAALGINRLKKWIPNFVHVGISIIIVTLLAALAYSVNFFSFIDISFTFVSYFIGGLILFSVIIESNRKSFVY